MDSIATGLKRNSNDIAWEFAICPDPTNLDKLKCTLCGKVYSGGASRMKQHIAHVKGNVAPCQKSTKDDQLRCRDAINEGKLKKKGKQAHDEALRSEVRFDTNENISIDTDEIENNFGSLREPYVIGPMDNFANTLNPEESLKSGKGKKVDINNAIRKERISTVKSFIGRWAYECAIPFHAFEKDSFKMMVEVIGQYGTGLPTPTRYELSNTILKKEVERTKNLVKKNEEEWKQDGCSIMTDAWFDRKRRSIMNLCVNSKMGTVFLSSKECSDEAHTSQHIYEYVESCIQEVGPEHVVQIVADNATNNMGAAKLLKEKRPKIFWTSCATHTINLMLEGIGGLPRFKKVLDQAKKLTIFIYAHHKTLAMMRKFTNKRDIIRPGVTRFASAYLTLQIKGRSSHTLVTGSTFWAGVALCLKVFSPLVKVLRMVDADWKPSMGFVYGEIKKAKKEIIDALGGNKKAYEPIINIISKKMKGRLDSKLLLTAYLLNPYYHYKDPQLQHDPKVMDAVLEFFDTLFAGDLEMQKQVVTIELPKYKKKMDRFGRELAVKACEANDADYDPAIWWGTFGGATPHLTKIAIRILSLTSSSSGCERNWSTFEGRKERNMEVLLANDSHTTQEWIVDCGDCDEDGVGIVGDGQGTDELGQSSRTRELLDEDFASGSEEEVFEEVDYESDGVHIMEEYRHKE
ncbi:unnamed protein product [Lactuca saligna]|uniref:BED-type domain-containing protein n=1 Tax=Lactuca saligna TaxID=75948 RepID=A0AA35ZWE7_LACSI|nr:unnamed protein product [Lactuca saligna]